MPQGLRGALQGETFGLRPGRPPASNVADEQVQGIRRLVHPPRAAGATAATGFLGGALVIAVLAVGLRAADLPTLALPAGGFVAGATAAGEPCAVARGQMETPAEREGTAGVR